MQGSLWLLALAALPEGYGADERTAIAVQLPLLSCRF